jgi:hypothetical protein
MTMIRAPMLGVAIGVLGFMLTVMGLFPGVTGASPTAGVGAIQFLAIMIGFSLLIFGALFYVKFTFYVRVPTTFAQEVAIRLCLTGLIFTAMAGLADFLGFGSHIPTRNSDVLFGGLQLIGVLGGFLMSSAGVLIYALTGDLSKKNTQESLV